jgi:hypothetical protein
MLRASASQPPASSRAIWARSRAGWAVKSKSVIVLIAGNPVYRMRWRAPDSARASHYHRLAEQGRAANWSSPGWSPYASVIQLTAAKQRGADRHLRVGAEG